MAIGGLANIPEDLHVPRGFRTIVWQISSLVMKEHYRCSISVFMFVWIVYIYVSILVVFVWRGLAVVFRFLCNWDLIDIYKTGIFYPDKAFRIDNMECIQVIQIKHRWRNRKKSIGGRKNDYLNCLKEALRPTKLPAGHTVSSRDAVSIIVSQVEVDFSDVAASELSLLL